MDFTSISDLERHYQAQIDAASEEDRPALITRRAEDKAAFWEQQAATQQRQAWISAALVKYPGAREIPELVSGATEQEVEVAAKAAHERVQRLSAPAPGAGGGGGGQPTQDELRQQATAAYGRGGGAGGGQPAPYTPADEALIQNVGAKWNAWRLEGADGPTTSEVDAFVRVRGGEHLRERMREIADLKYGKGSRLAPGQP